jgi:hypothetical protein
VRTVSSFRAALLGLAGLALAPAAGASVIQGASLGRNECAGYGFATCYATTAGTQGSAADGAWQSLYKQNSDGTADFGSFAAISGAEFRTVFDASARRLSFTYTPAANDPESMPSWCPRPAAACCSMTPSRRSPASPWTWGACSGSRAAAGRI